MIAWSASLQQHCRCDTIMKRAHLQLTKVPSNAAPVVVDESSIYDKLQQAQYTTGKVQQDVLDAEAACALTPDVEQHLRRVLDERDVELDQREKVDDVEPLQCEYALRIIAVATSKKNGEDARADGNTNGGQRDDSELR